MIGVAGGRWAMCFAAIVLSSGLATEAQAYNWPTHQRMVEAAVDAMTSANEAPVPAGIDEATWRAYMARFAASTGRLLDLRTGLAGAYRGGGYPGPTQPGRPPDISTFVPTYNDPELCGYHGTTVDPARDLNLLHAGRIQIRNFPYLARKEYAPCAYEPAGKLAKARDVLGRTLGWHGAHVDDRVNDSVLWVKPTSMGFNGLFTEVASRAFELAGGVLALPFVCLAAWLSGDSCDADDAFDLAKKLNVVEYVQGLLPGIGDIRGEDYVGLWHFIHVDSDSNRFNDMRGMSYGGAGTSHPGAVDVAIMAAADVLGLSLNASASKGVELYGRFDRVHRSWPQWQAHTIGHVEFSPVSHLAQYGWDRYNGTDADSLGWPLHAIGDAAAPHHVTGTTSWGHRPFEEAVEKIEQDLLPLVANGGAFPAFRDRVLRIAFDAFRGLEGDPSIQAYITREAFGTRQIARDNDDWVFNDSTSVEWQTGWKSASERTYTNEPAILRKFVEHGVGYTIGFLVRAGEQAQDPGLDPVTLCPPGHRFTGIDPGCTDAPLEPVPPPAPLPPDVALATCSQYGNLCAVDKDCCEGVPCVAATSKKYGRCIVP